MSLVLQYSTVSVLRKSVAYSVVICTVCFNCIKRVYCIAVSPTLCLLFRVIHRR